MAGITHSKVSAIEDGADATLVRPSDWNAAHVVEQAITDNAVVTVDQDGAADNDIAKFTGNGIEGRSYAEVKADLDLEIGTDIISKSTFDTHESATTGVHGLDGRRNAIINGCAIVDQRAADYTLVKDTYGIRADRWYGMATGTLVSAGVLTKTTAANCGKTGHAFKFSGVTLTGTGIIYLRYRMEANDAIHFKNQTASFQCKVYQDTGGAINYTVYVRKANAADGFSAVTAISNSGAISVPNTTETTLPYLAISMGDCSNGIEIEIKVECGAISTKNFEFTELQFELGSVATAFEFRYYEQELAMCQRYFWNIGGDHEYSPCSPLGIAVSTTVASAYVLFPVKMRAIPTFTYSNLAHFYVSDGVALITPTVLSTLGRGKYQDTVVMTVASGLTQYRSYALLAANTLSARLNFSAEL